MDFITDLISQEPKDVFIIKNQNPRPQVETYTTPLKL